MGVGLYLTGTYPSGAVETSSDDWLERVASWIESHEVEPLMLCRTSMCEEGEAILLVQIHPCAEEVEFRSPEAGVCVVAAKTSTAGPGYHIFLCDLLSAFGKHFHVEWDLPDEDAETGDDTGFFFERDAGALRQEMLVWLSAIARLVLENCNDEDVAIRMVSMPLDYSYPDQTGILTPLGPRSPTWFAECIEAPEKGVDFFPWWAEGVGAPFFLGRALCRMWQEVHWRTPITDDEGEILMEVHLDLERAYHLDANSSIPWREWAELIDYLNEYFGYTEFQHEESLEEEITKRAAATDSSLPLVGYRRGRVQVTLAGGWSIAIPGEMAEEWETNGETWSAWHGGRTVWFTCWNVRDDNDEPLEPRDILDSRPPWPEGGEIIEHADGALLGRAVFLPYDEDGESLWNLKAYSAVAGTFALCNVFLQSRNDLPWALEVWKSLRN